MAKKTDDLVLEEMTIKDFELYSTNALKSFLYVRGKKTSGSDSTLISRAFAAYEEGCQVDENKVQRERLLLQTYQEKFSGKTCDPLLIKEKWLGEVEGLEFWPSVYFSDISRYFQKIGGKDNLLQRLECEYKEKKAYRYFSNGFIGEVFCNTAESETICIFKTKCVPSQRVSSRSYDVWALVQKDGKFPGGEIISGYCTCTAGLLGSCNHVAGMLFRVEAAVLAGMNKKTCTETLASWNVPATKKKIQPGRLSSFLVSSDSYKTKATQKSVEELANQAKRRQDYTPMHDEQRGIVNDKAKMRKDLFRIIGETIPKSTFTEVMTAQKRNVRSLPASNINPKSIIDAANTLGENCRDVQNLISSVTLSEDEIIYIYNNTALQSESDLWYAQRKGRITASKFKRVYTRMKTFLMDENTDMSAVIDDVMGNKKTFQSKAMKRGIAMEIHAKEVYKKVQRKDHLGATFSDPGFMILIEQPFIGASPDLEIVCTCHGAGLVEIKCPNITTIPNDETYLNVLEKVDGIVKLKRNHAYYYQIQGQMGVTKKKYADFFVYTNSGHFFERIEFDEIFFNDMLFHLVLFWKEIIAPELLFKNTQLSGLVTVKKPEELDVDFTIDFEIYLKAIDFEKPIEIVN